MPAVQVLGLQAGILLVLEEEFDEREEEELPHVARHRACGRVQKGPVRHRPTTQQ
jgi:hypothetical protein